MRNRGARNWRMHFSNRMWLLLALLALLPVMAFIQYRWIGQVSDAAQQRAKARLENSVEQLITEFDAEITRAHMTFWQISGDETPVAARFANRYQEWSRLAPYPQLISDLYLIETADDSAHLSHIDSSGRVLAMPEWPSDLVEVRSRLEQMSRPGQPGFRWPANFDDLSIHGNPVFVAPMREARPGSDPFRRWPPGPGNGSRYRGQPGRDERRRPPSRMLGWAV